MIHWKDATDQTAAFVALNRTELTRRLNDLGGGRVEIVTPCGDKHSFRHLPSGVVPCSCGNVEHATLLYPSPGRA